MFKFLPIFFNSNVFHAVNRNSNLLNKKIKLAFFFLLAINIGKAYSQCSTDNMGIIQCNRTATGDQIRTAIQNAAEGSIIRLPATGTSRITIPGTISINRRGIKIEGAGRANTNLQITATTGDLFFIGADQVSISNLSLYRNNTSQQLTGVGIWSTGGGTFIENCAFYGFFAGVRLENSAYSATINSCIFESNRDGIHTYRSKTSTNGSWSNDLLISNCTFWQQGRYGIWVNSDAGGDDPDLVVIKNNAIERCGRSGINIQGGNGVVIAENYFEQNDWQADANNDFSTANDCHIQIDEGTASMQIRNVTIDKNFFGNYYNTDNFNSYGVVGSNSKSENLRPASGTTTPIPNVRPWRILNSSGINLQHRANWYTLAQYTAGGSGVVIVKSDSYVCTNSATCF